MGFFNHVGLRRCGTLLPGLALLLLMGCGHWQVCACAEFQMKAGPGSAVPQLADLPPDSPLACMGASDSLRQMLALEPPVFSISGAETPVQTLRACAPADEAVVRQLVDCWLWCWESWDVQRQASQVGLQLQSCQHLLDSLMPIQRGMEDSLGQAREDMVLLRVYDDQGDHLDVPQPAPDARNRQALAQRMQMLNAEIEILLEKKVELAIQKASVTSRLQVLEKARMCE